MPTFYIDEETFAKYVEKYGYLQAKKEIANIVKKYAPEVKKREIQS